MIRLCNINKSYGDNEVYSDFCLDILDGKVTAVLGESGSGKTTLLNIIVGLTSFTGELQGVNAGESMSYVFQTDRLVPNLTVAENLELVCGDLDKSNILAALKSAGLEGKSNHYPAALSAGMKRRVALVRAFLFNSSVILMDEPFINLDPALKYSLMDEFCRLQKESGRTAVFVTHDVKEACYIADRIVILSRGQVVYDNGGGKKDEEEILGIMLKMGSVD